MGSQSPRPGQGFEGSISNLSLPDVIQLQGQNRFSGSISVAYDGGEGVIFMQGGEVVHAEAGPLRGEDAFTAILSWPAGNFVVHPNVSTVSRTVEKGLNHLLLDAHRRMDEAQRANPDASPSAGRAPGAQRGGATTTRKVRTVPGVTCAVVLDRGGNVLSDGGPAEESLAAKSLHLTSTIASEIGEALQLGELQQASMSSQAEQLLLFRSRDNYLAVSIAGGRSLADVEAGIRQALGTKPGGA